MNVAVALIFALSISWPPAESIRSHGCLELPAPDFRAVDAAGDASQWQNPYLVVQPKGIELTTGTSHRKQVVPLSDLETALRRLPATAWPYGRIAAVQEAGVRSGLKSDDELISRNQAEVESSLAKLCIKISYWPSA